MRIREYREDTDFEAVLEIYESVNWQNYTNDVYKLKSALTNSHKTYVFYQENKVRGLVRTISDGFTICYIQDLLVHSDYQHRGIGKELVRHILHSNEHIRQIVLMTDAKEELKNFYASTGFREVKDDLCAFARLK